MEKQTVAPEKTADQKYVKPTTKKHEPVKIVQGSGHCSLYYTVLYYYY